MKFYYLTFRSVTYAQKAERELIRAGIRCTLQRTPRWMEVQGCGYSLRLWTEDTEPALRVLRSAQLIPRRVWVQGRDGQLEEVVR